MKNVQSLSYKLGVPLDQMERILKKNGIKIRGEEIRDFEFYRVLNEVSEFRDDFYTINDIVRIFHLDRGTVEQLARAGFLRGTTCKWLAHDRMRFSPDSVRELVCRLEFADDEWHQRNALAILKESADRFPGADAWENFCERV